MKKLKKIAAAFLGITMCFSCFAPVVYGEENKKNSVTIFIDGINSENIIDPDSGEIMYPPQGKSIAGAVIKNIPTLTKALLTGRHEIVIDPLTEAINDLFAPIKVDENGNIPSDTKFDYTWPDEEEILAFVENDAPDKRLKYAFDWRLDMQTIASDLHDFIEYVMKVTGAESVSLIACSMGGCALFSYLKMYDCEYVDSAIALVGAMNGTSCCGEPFAGKIVLDSDTIVRYVDTALGFDLGGLIVGNLLHTLNAAGVMDPLIRFANGLAEELKDAVYEKVFTTTFANCPGMWALVPYDLYDQAMVLAGGGMNARNRERADWYHNEVQANTTEILQTCLDRGIHVGVIAKYGYPAIPCFESSNAMGDSVIDTRLESFGATCADVDKTLGEDYRQAVDNGHNCLSPDGLIDSSTCDFCDYTWFIKNSKHADSFAQSAIICNYIIHSDEQVTVWNDELPQYLVIEGEDLVPVTADNAPAVYKTEIENETVFSVFIDSVRMFNALVKNFFSSLFRWGR